MKLTFFKTCIFYILVSYLLLFINTNLSFAQNIGEKFTIEITPDSKKFPVFEQADVSSAFLGVIKNEDTVSVLLKKQDWIKITLPSGEKGWVKYYSSGSDFESWKFKPVNPRKRDVPQKQQVNNAEDINKRLTIIENKVQHLESIIMKLNAASSAPSNAISQPPKPSQSEIKSAIKNHLKFNVPITWAGNLMGGKNAQLSSIEVIQVGIYNTTQKYWPMKIRCVGICELNDPFNQGKRVSFNRVGEFVLYKDDYGKWKAQMKDGLFQ